MNEKEKQQSIIHIEQRAEVRALLILLRVVCALASLSIKLNVC